MQTKEMVPRLRFSNYVYETVSIESLYDFIPTNSFSRDNLNYESGSVKNIHYGDILTDFQTHFDVNKERVPYINESIELSKYSDFNFCKPGDLIFADASEDYNGIGKHVEIISVSGPNILAGLHTIHARLISDKVEIGFMTYQLQSWSMRFQIMRIAQGTKVFGISSKRLGKLFANIPPKNEQQKIASFLSSVDEKISQLEKKKTLLETYKRGIMQKIFSQELRFKKEDGNLFDVWAKPELNQIFDKVKLKNKSNESLPVLTNSAKNGIVIQEDFFERDIANKNNLEGYYIVEIGDFVYNPRISKFAPVGPINRNKLKKGLVSPLYTVFRLTSSELDNNFLSYLFDSSCWHKYLKSIANYGARHDRMNLTNDGFFGMPLNIPTHQEQQKIASFLSSIDRKIEITSTQLEKTREFKKGLLQQMFV